MVHEPSLRRRLLWWVTLPLLAVLVIGAIASYMAGLHYANTLYDHWLLDNAHAIGELANSDASSVELNAQARGLLDISTPAYNRFAVRSQRHGLLAGDPELSYPAASKSPSAAVYSSFMHGTRHMRMVSVFLPAQATPGDVLVVSVAEDVNNRNTLARELLFTTVPIELLLIVAAMALVWSGIRRGLHMLAPLTHEIHAREAGDLAPLRTRGVPAEVKPLVITIDALLARVDRMIRQQQRFIADAAHQLRTPLAGLRIQAERALADPSPETVRAALAHVERLSAGTARTAGQLLALARAQAPEEALGAAIPTDLAALVRDEVAARAPAAIAAGFDLGYRGLVAGAHIHGDAALLRELLGNLIDNALRYCKHRNPVVTVTVHGESSAGSNAAGCVLEVEDNGPGVAPEWLPRLGERFFRVVGNTQPGSGLGLAIVRTIAERHGASLDFAGRSNAHGLRVTIRFPPAPH